MREERPNGEQVVGQGNNPIIKRLKGVMEELRCRVVPKELHDLTQDLLRSPFTATKYVYYVGKLIKNGMTNSNFETIF